MTEILRDTLNNRINEIQRKVKYNKKMITLKNKRKTSLKNIITKLSLEGDTKDNDQDILFPLIEKQESN